MTDRSLKWFDFWFQTWQTSQLKIRVCCHNSCEPANQLPRHAPLSGHNGGSTNCQSEFYCTFALKQTPGYPSTLVNHSLCFGIKFDFPSCGKCTLHSRHFSVPQLGNNAYIPVLTFIIQAVIGCPSESVTRNIVTIYINEETVVSVTGCGSYSGLTRSVYTKKKKKNRIGQTFGV